ncbi:M2 family metallopeptidase [Biformimicrobium ophioploci]|uniref:M2 family metallopeptidase n=1 Tax=Biformimicrobium ophioploci TaxID=3036711 RepID=A0ABQ6M2N5_9GAMM|nr:M2 family metallopeptidase [Microbulbifer sp. NKW57]GMG88557.1 M2 family metallopeptidase [Microbulbifer sp. NKW57]
MKKLVIALGAAAALTACAPEQESTTTSAPQAAAANSAQEGAKPTAADAKAFLEAAEKSLKDIGIEGAHAAWVAQTYINIDSQFIEAKVSERGTALAVKLAAEAARFDSLDLDAETRRKLDKLKQVLVIPAPQDEAMTAELADIMSKLTGMYGAGKYCSGEGDAQKCYSLTDMTAIMAKDREPELLKELWVGWRKVSPPMRPLYQRQVEIGNAGAQELGYDNLSVFWRSKYDMEPDAFAADVDAQWNKVKPLYDALHCAVRDGLNKHYGDDVVPADGKIPAHLLGNMWAQTWGNVYDLVKPEGAEAPYDLTALIEKAGMDEMEMVRTGEKFFTSLGFEPLPETFWERSQFSKPRDREVVCHASAWNLDYKDDLRIKMCIQKTGEEFNTVHHELGHNFYQRAYNQQPILFQGSANDGFHEAVGDTVALSITPKYLMEIGLLNEEPGADKDIGYLMQMALDKIAFLPFGLLVDKWRWQVFNGEVSPEDYNKAWWALREKYQGIEAPVERTEADFDPGAKYHIPGNTPYTRYFLAFIQQFQFHRALCETAGFEGPLHRCSIYSNDAAGERLRAMMEMGSSQPWQDAMEALTGQRELDASAIIDYFQPLMTYLEEQNKGRNCGWE